MARNLFGGSSDDYVVDSSGRPVASRRVRFYTSTARTTEITDLASDAAGTGSPLTVSTDVHGFLGPVYGPDAVTVMYAGAVDAAGNPPTYVVAVYTHSSSAAGVSSFNTRTGDIALSKTDVTGTGLAAADVGADASGAAAAVQTNLTSEVTRAQAAEAALGGGMQFRTAVVVATTNQALSALPTVDGVTLTAGQVILLTGQTAGSQNGLWAVAVGAWARPSNFAAGSNATATSVLVESGTAGGGTTYAVTGTSSNVVGTNVLTFVKTSGSAASGATYITASGDTTGATDGPAINAAIAAVFAAGGGIVEIVGACWTNVMIVPKAGVWLRGQGWTKSSINLATGANCPVIQPGATYYDAKITDLAIDGWKENQGAGAWYGIDLSVVGSRGGAASNVYIGGQGIFIERVLVRSTKNHGVYSPNNASVELRLTDVYAYGCDGCGYSMNGSDAFMLNCTAGGNLQHGFDIGGLGLRLNNCKSWQSGWSFSRTFTSTYPTGGDTSKHGFNITGAQNCTLTSCEAQDNAGVGLNMGGDCCQAFAFNADANLSGAYQLYVNARHCLVEGIVGNGTSHNTPSPSVVNIWNSSAVGNKVRVSWPNNTQGATAGIAAGAKQYAPQNDIVIGTPDAQYALGWQATVTPDPFYGSPFFTLAGNTTIANPAADRYVPGMRFRVTAVQDGTGSRTVTFGSDFITATTVTATASQATTWLFECMNGKWVETSAKGALVGITVPTVAPGQVGTVTATPGNAQVALSWSAPNNGGSAITDYVIQYRTTAGPGAWNTFADGTSTATTATVTGLTNTTSYDFQVAAVNAIGQGAYSNAVTSTPVLLTTYVSDAFTRANSTTTLGVADTGQTWLVSAGGGPWGINTNQAYCPGADFSQAFIDSTVADCVIRATFNAAASTALVIRYADSNNNLSVTSTTLSGTVTGAGLGNLATWSAFADGDVITVVLSGGTVTVKQNGTTVGTSSAGSMAPLQTNTKHGLQARGNALGRWSAYSVKSA